MEKGNDFLEPNENKHVFIRSAFAFEVGDLIKYTNNYIDYDLNEVDQIILREIHNEISTSNKLPFWWTAQESYKLSKIKNHGDALNYIVFRYKFKRYPVIKREVEFPLYVLIEPASVCNLRCPFCFQMDKEFTRKPYAGLMDIELFKRIVDECEANGTQAITLASRGEPTLHPGLSLMLEYLKGKFFEIKLNTNGTRLTDKLCHAIFENEVDDLVLSIDTEKAELFEVLRKNASFEKVLENVRNLNRIKAEYYPNSNTVIRISGVNFLPEQNNDSFMRFWESLADEITVSECEERWDTYNNDVKPELTEPCSLLWERFYIWFDGTCNPCDVDYKSELSPGSLNVDESIKSIWNSKAYKSLRLKHLDGLRRDVKPCDRCGVY